MFDKLTSVEARYDQVMAEMADPAVQADTTRFRNHSKALSEMQPLVEQFREYKDVLAQIATTQELVRDPDMRELAQEELASLEARREALLADIRVLLVPKDPNDQRNVVLEIRAGTGGDEAAIFAGDLYRMYLRFAIFMCKITKTQPSYLLHPLDLIGKDHVPSLAFFPGMNIKSEQKLKILEMAIKILKQNFELVPMSAFSKSLSPDLKKIPLKLNHKS